MENMSNTRRKHRRSPLRWVLPLIIVLVMIVGGLAAANRYYMILCGDFISRDASVTDLRTYRLSLKEYENIKNQYPEREYRWSVPLSGGRFDSYAESITVNSLTEKDMALLSYFTGLRTIDALDAQVSPELFLAMKEAWPEIELRWRVPIGTGRYDSWSETLTLVSDFSMEELSDFSRFPYLRTVDARGCGCYDQILALRELRPDLEVLWQVSLGGDVFEQDAKYISISGKELTMESFLQLLSRLPALERVDMTETPFTVEEKTYLLDTFPDMTFGWEIDLLGLQCTTAEESVSLAGRTDLGEAQFRELMNTAPLLRGWENLDLTGCSFTQEQIMAISDALPKTHVLWSFDWCGVPVTTADEEVDLSNIPMSDTLAVEKMLPYMFNLKKVIMCDCGIEDEEMDALNHRHEDVRFVWMLHVSLYQIRTDVIGFRGTSVHYGSFTGESAWKLTYCEDLICLDLGHRVPLDLSFLTGMPQLEYLIINEGFGLSDITPLSSLKNLRYLELFMNYNVHDISPLLGCTSLTDLDICHVGATDQDKNFEILRQMTWLERLWYSSDQLSEEQEEQLKEEIPGLITWRGIGRADCTAGTWRADIDYYEMRDILGMYYMGPVGGIVSFRVLDGVRYDLVDGEWVALGKDPNFGVDWYSHHYN